MILKANHIIFSLALLSGVSFSLNTNAQEEVSILSLEELKTAEVKNPLKGEGLLPERNKALKETAIRFAAANSFLFHAEEININLISAEEALNKTFNFNPYVLSDPTGVFIFPPVIIENNGGFKIKENYRQIYLYDQTYIISKYGKILSIVPTWKDYLLLKQINVYSANQIKLAPRNKKEKQIWLDGLNTGWNIGKKQAYFQYEQNLYKLKRELQGVILYHTLLMENKIDAVYLASSEDPFQIENDTLRIGGRIIQITKNINFQDEEKWTPLTQK